MFIDNLELCGIQYTIEYNYGELKNQTSEVVRIEGSWLLINVSAEAKNIFYISARMKEGGKHTIWKRLEIDIIPSPIP